jgi:hypothetical protein
MQGEYRGDFTRDTFHPANHFSRVLMQQGRVQVDADWNEQGAILLHYLRSLGADLIGPHGGPGPNPGFEIQPISGSANDFRIGAGHYYVDGILCELGSTPVTAVVMPATPPAALNEILMTRLTVDGDAFQEGQTIEVSIPGGGPVAVVLLDAPVAASQILTVEPVLATAFSGQPVQVRRLMSYRTQPDFPVVDKTLTFDDVADQCLVYLDVWERHLTSVEQENIREVALGGSDTASRAKVIWQVKTSSQIQGLKIQETSSNPPKKYIGDDIWNQYVATQLQPANRGLLKARIQPQMTANDPCITSPTASYRGTENQLYRVEIQGGGTGWNGTFDSTDKPVITGTPATFKWSRENGSVIFQILKMSSGSGVTTVNLASLGRDEKLTLNVNDWVEVVDDESDLLGSSVPQRPLLQVQAIDAVAMTVTLAGTILPPADGMPATHSLLRRWDHQAGDHNKNGLTLQVDGGALLLEGADDKGWLNLENGIQIQFQSDGKYRSGDYWLIPARVATGDIEWPRLRDAQGRTVFDSNNAPIPDALPPHGVEHHYAPLAMLNGAGGAISLVADLRRPFQPISEPAP